jgi:photosystem II stability/assembly factor-like uncharacterized protein
MNDGILRSTDGGANWERINEGLDAPDVFSIKIDPVAGVLYLGTIGTGIYKSTDNGETWEKISDNINLANCYHAAFDNGNQNMLYIRVGNSLIRTEDEGQNWENCGPTIPQTHGIRGIKTDFQFQNTIYASTGHASGNFPIDSTGFFRSTDSGDSWLFFNTGLPPFNNYYDIAISAPDIGSRRFFLASNNGLYYSDSEGQSWILSSSGLPVDVQYKKIEVAPSNPDILAVGDLINNRVYISDDRGDSWYPAGNIPGGGLQFMTLEFDPANDSIIYVSSLNAGIFKSYDRGASWHSIMNNLPFYPDFISISPILINPLNPDNIFVCSYKRGIYQSHDGGDSWESFNNGLDTVIYSGDMIFAPGDTNTIIYASGCKSVWTITRTLTGIEEETMELPAAISMNGYPNPFNSEIILRYNANWSERITIEIYDIMGRKVKTLINQIVESGPNTVRWDGTNDNDQTCPSGVYFARLKAGGSSTTTKMLLLK